MGDLEQHPDAAELEQAMNAAAAELSARQAAAVAQVVNDVHDGLLRAGVPDVAVHLMLSMRSTHVILREAVLSSLRFADDQWAVETLDGRLAIYLTRRGHTLSTDALTGHAQHLAQAEYVLGECEELVDAVEANDRDEDRGAVFDEIADVVLSATTLARYLGTTVEARIERKTTKDTGRG